jgi:O-6-methylguanine DNA methyltransferase
MSFDERVWELTRKIPRGRVSTYREIAMALGNPGAVRAVGNALNRNPDMKKTPCYRVIRSDGRIGGFAKGSREKERLLRAEGIGISNGKVKLTSFLFRFLRRDI